MKVKSVPGVRVAHHGVAVGHNMQARYIGYVFKDGQWCTNDDVVELPFSHEYARAVKEGSLEAADAETASICGVTFED